MTWDKNIPPEDRKFYNVSRFSPDTCGCVLEYAWDKRTTEEDRVHLPADIVHACKHHEYHCVGGKKVDDHYHEITGENSHKNLALAAILDHLDDEHVDIVKDQHDNEMRQFKKPPRWSFNDKRELVVELDDVSDGHCKEISGKVNNHCNTRKTHIK